MAEKIDRLLEKMKAQRPSKPRYLLPRALPFASYIVELGDVDEGELGLEAQLLKLEPRTDIRMPIPRRDAVKVLEAIKRGQHRFIMTVTPRTTTIEPAP